MARSLTVNQVYVGSSPTAPTIFIQTCSQGDKAPGFGPGTEGSNPSRSAIYIKFLKQVTKMNMDFGSGPKKKTNRGTIVRNGVKMTRCYICGQPYVHLNTMLDMKGRVVAQLCNNCNDFLKKGVS